MGVIQNAVNQALGTGTMIAAGTKHFQDEKVAATRNLVKEGAAATTSAAKLQAEQLEGTQLENVAKEALKSSEATETQLKHAVSALQSSSKNTILGNKKQLDVLKGYQSQVSDIYKDVKTMGEMVPDILRQEEQMKKVEQMREAKKQLKRNFKDYLSKLETSFGGTVGELPKNMQSAIMKLYTSSERKKLMDTMDKEKMNKDGK